MNRRGQIWVETVIYTLIGLTIIAILLSIANPQIEKIKDRGILKQTKSALDLLDAKINEVEQTPGRIGIVDFKVGKGKLEINSENNFIRYTLENSRLEYSEVGSEIIEGNVIIKTEESGRKYNIMLTRDYSTLNLSYENRLENKMLQAGTTPYRIQIENVGVADPNESPHIDFRV